MRQNKHNIGAFSPCAAYCFRRFYATFLCKLILCQNYAVPFCNIARHSHWHIFKLGAQHTFNGSIKSVAITMKYSPVHNLPFFKKIPNAVRDFKLFCETTRFPGPEAAIFDCAYGWGSYLISYSPFTITSTLELASIPLPSETGTISKWFAGISIPLDGSFPAVTSARPPFSVDITVALP